MLVTIGVVVDAHATLQINWTTYSSLPGHNGRHFADDILRCISMSTMIFISIKISLEFVPKGSIGNNPALVQIMALHRIGDKPLSDAMLTRFTDVYMRN